MRLLLLCLAACATPADTASVDTATDDTATDDTAAADTAAADPLCADAVPLTWETFGEGFLLESCDVCHTESAPDRFGAPVGVSFDTVEQAWSWSGRILARSTGEDPDMPPMGGVTEDDRTRLYWWLGCGTPGT